MPPKISDDYGHGQMMGMLVVIQLFENAYETGVDVPQATLNIIKNLASSDLSGYLKKPQEDVMLLVEEQLRSI